jgi:hypothetical protein
VPLLINPHKFPTTSPKSEIPNSLRRLIFFHGFSSQITFCSSPPKRNPNHLNHFILFLFHLVYIVIKLIKHLSKEEEDDSAIPEDKKRGTKTKQRGRRWRSEISPWIPIYPFRNSYSAWEIWMLTESPLIDLCGNWHRCKSQVFETAWAKDFCLVVVDSDVAANGGGINFHGQIMVNRGSDPKQIESESASDR